MSYSQLIVYLLEIIGTVAFAFSGAILGIQKNMDIFGINVLGITTAVGGGMIRDLILGITPPNLFRHPSYTICAIMTSCLTFAAIYLHKEFINDIHTEKFSKYMNIMDSIGLGAFTVIGINTALATSYGSNHFLLIFVGVITGVGGGVIRDIMAGVTPYIFVKHIYACASLAGAVICIALKAYIPETLSLIIGAIVVILIRFLAAHYRWNLPKIK